MVDSKKMQGSRVLVTGASRGLGRAIVSAFWESGSNVAAVARDRRGLEELRASLPRSDAQSLELIQADLEDPSSPAAIVSTLRSKWENLDVLVNNAAIIGPIGPLWENDWPDWERTIQVNLLAPIRLARLCVPWMRAGSSIVNLSGGGATSARPNFTAYGTAKAAMVRFTETLAQETQPLGIRVNAVAPGIMKTEMLDAVLRAGPAAAGGKEYDAAARQQQSGGVSPEVAAALIVYLASPESLGVSGRLISAVWDSWADLGERAEELRDSDIYTLRRITPADRGKPWT